MHSDDLDALRRDIGSSPLPSPSSSPRHEVDLSSSSPAPVTASSSNPRKRSFQDFSQYASSVSRSLKLPKTDLDELVKFAKVCIFLMTWQEVELICLCGDIAIARFRGEADMACRPHLEGGRKSSSCNCAQHCLQSPEDS